MLDYWKQFAYPDHLSLLLETPTDMKMKCVIKKYRHLLSKSAMSVCTHVSNETA